MKIYLKWDYFWFFLTFSSALIFLFLSFQTINSLIDYYALDRKAPVQIFSWEIKNIKDHYYLIADYQYQNALYKLGKFLFVSHMRHFFDYP